METKTCMNLKLDEAGNGWTEFECSECRATVGGIDAPDDAPEDICLVVYEGDSCGYSPFSYCPNCGAKVAKGE